MCSISDDQIIGLLHVSIGMYYTSIHANTYSLCWHVLWYVLWYVLKLVVCIEYIPLYLRQ